MMKNNISHFYNIPHVVRENNISETPLERIAIKGMVAFEKIASNYSLSPTKSPLVPVIFFDSREIPISFHRHDYLELIFVFRGTVISKSREEIVLMKTGDIWISNFHQEHSMVCSDGEVTLINICLSKELLRTDLYQHFLSEKHIISEFLENPDHVFLYFPAKHHKMTDQILEVLLTTLNNDKVAETSIQAFVLFLLSELSINPEYKFDVIDRRMVDILAFMEEHYQNVSIKSMAKYFGYTENYLTRFIKKQSGQNASKLIMDIKFSKACELLIDTDLTIDMISEAVGYQSMAYFYRFFKNYYGITPRQYRERYRHREK